MKRLYAFMFLPLGLAACQTTLEPDPAPTTVVKKIQDQKPLVHYPTNSGTNLFYTYPFKLSDLEKVEVLENVKVQLNYDEGCIYFQYGRHKAVPLLPYGVSSWDENNKTLKYFNAIYKVGDTIDGSGTLTSKANPNGYVSNGFRTTPSDKCDLEKMLVLFGLPES